MQDNKLVWKVNNDKKAPVEVEDKKDFVIAVGPQRIRQFAIRVDAIKE